MTAVVNTMTAAVNTLMADVSVTGGGHPKKKVSNSNTTPQGPDNLLSNSRHALRYFPETSNLSEH